MILFKEHEEKTMIKAIKKRDGRVEDFKKEKISKAISKAFKSVGNKVNEEELNKTIVSLLIL